MLTSIRILYVSASLVLLMTDVNNASNLGTLMPLHDDDIETTQTAVESWVPEFENYYAQTMDFDVDTSLRRNHAKLIEFRDQVYATSQVTARDENRLNVIAQVASFAFLTIDPRCQYTKNTDIKHFKEISYLSAHQWVDEYPQTKVPITLVIAGWFHDIERYIPETRRKKLVQFACFRCLCFCFFFH